MRGVLQISILSFLQLSQVLFGRECTGCSPGFLHHLYSYTFAQGVALGYVLAALSGRAHAGRIGVYGRDESPMVSLAQGIALGNGFHSPGGHPGPGQSFRHLPAEHDALHQHSGNMEGSLEDIAFCRLCHRTVAMQIAIPFALLTVGQMPIGPF